MVLLKSGAQNILPSMFILFTDMDYISHLTFTQFLHMSHVGNGSDMNWEDHVGFTYKCNLDYSNILKCYQFYRLHQYTQCLIKFKFH